MSIHSRAMLVNLSISTWAARKYDKSVTARFHAAEGATQDAGRYNKHLLARDAESYKALIQAATGTRTEHYHNTLAWSDDGWRLLPTDNYMAYTDLIRARSAAFETALDTFLAEYPALKNAAQARLNGMYRESDYPTVDALRGKFSMSVEYSPLPASGDVRVDLPEEHVRAIEASISDRVQNATKEAMKDAWNRLFEAVSHMHARLSDPKAIFRDSLITSTREVVDLLGRLNVTGDTHLDAMRDKVRADLTKFDPQTLRDDTFARSETAAKAKDIMAAMSGVYGGSK